MRHLGVLRTSRVGELAALTTAASSIVLADSGVSVLAPDLRRSFSLSLTGLGWVSSSYALTVALLALPASRAACRLGQRRALQVGLLLFALGTAGLALAQTPGALIGARVLEGAGTALVSPTMLAILRREPRENSGRSLALWSAISTSMVAVAPLVAAVAAATAWRIYFFGCVATVFAAFMLVSRALPVDRQGQPPPHRSLVVLGSASFAALDLALIIRRLSLSGPLLLIATSCLFCIWYGRGRIQRQAPIWRFAGPAVAGLAVNALFASILFLVPLYDRIVLGLPPIDAAVSLAVIALPAIMVGPKITGWSLRRGPRVPMTAGSLILALAMVAGARWTSHGDLAGTLPALALIGVGFGMLMAPVTALTLAGLPRSRLLEGAAVLACVRMLGMGVGVWVTSLIAAGAPSCVRITHICLDALSADLTRPFLLDAGAGAALTLLILLALRRPSLARA